MTGHSPDGLVFGTQHHWYKMLENSMFRLHAACEQQARVNCRPCMIGRCIAIRRAIVLLGMLSRRPFLDLPSKVPLREGTRFPARVCFI
jgi:hypothetical protein